MLYLALFIIILLVGLYFENHKVNPKTEQYCYIGVGIFLFLFAGFRYYTGFDYNNYLNQYNLIQDYSLVQVFLGQTTINAEYVFQLILRLAPSYTWVLLLSSAMGVLLKVYLFDRFSINKWMTLAFYFSSFFMMYEMGAIRQGIAVSFLFLSIPFILDRKLWSYLGLVSVASLFHVSAVFFLPVYFFTFKLKKRYILGIIAFLGIFLVSGISNIMVEFLIQIAPESIAYKLSYYLSEATPTLGVLFSFGKRLFFLMLFYFGIEKAKAKLPESKTKYFDLLFNIYLFSIIVYIVFLAAPTIGGRAAQNLSFAQLLLFPTLLYLSSKDVVRNVIYGMLIVLSLNSMIDLFAEGDMVRQYYVPYRNVFTK
ncbi:MAG: EpsG family protein [Erysipelotrichaceae bacterium]